MTEGLDNASGLTPTTDNSDALKNEFSELCVTDEESKSNATSEHTNEEKFSYDATKIKKFEPFDVNQRDLIA